MTDYQNKIKSKHPYQDRITEFTYIGSMKFDNEEIPLYNTEDGYTVSLETILKQNGRETLPNTIRRL